MSESVDVARAAFGVLAKFMRKKRKLKKHVSRMFRDSLTETEIYWGKLTRGDERDYEVEADLARRWSSSAAAAAEHDKELSDACLSVSRYWANPPVDPVDGIHDLLGILWNLLSDKRNDRIIQYIIPKEDKGAGLSF